MFLLLAADFTAFKSDWTAFPLYFHFSSTQGLLPSAIMKKKKRISKVKTWKRKKTECRKMP